MQQHDCMVADSGCVVKQWIANNRQPLQQLEQQHQLPFFGNPSVATAEVASCHAVKGLLVGLVLKPFKLHRQALLPPLLQNVLCLHCIAGRSGARLRALGLAHTHGALVPDHPQGGDMLTAACRVPPERECEGIGATGSR
jgi:hypothetical protein